MDDVENVSDVENTSSPLDVGQYITVTRIIIIVRCIHCYNDGNVTKNNTAIARVAKGSTDDL